MVKLYSKTCLKQPLSKRLKIVFQDQLSLNAGQKYCRMLQGEHSAILSTFIKLLFVIKISVLSIFEWPLKTGFTLLCLKVQADLGFMILKFFFIPPVRSIKGVYSFCLFCNYVCLSVCLFVCLFVCKLFFRQRFLSNYLGKDSEIWYKAW